MNNTQPDVKRDPIVDLREKISERMRKDIGDLMPDETLQKLVADAVQAQLYHPTKSPLSYNEPLPWVRVKVQEQIGSDIKKHVEAEITANSDEIQKVVVQQIKEQLPKFVGIALVELMKGGAHTLANEVSSRINRGY